MIKIKDILTSTKTAPSEFPVETALGLTFFVAAIIFSECDGGIFSGATFAFVPLLFAITITLRKLKIKVGYYLSYLLFWVVNFLFKDTVVLDEPCFWVWNIIAVLVVTTDLKCDNNQKFANSVVVSFVQIVSAVLICLILSAMVSAIIGSVIFLFDVKWFRLLMYSNLFVLLVVLPLAFCYLQEHADFDYVSKVSFLRIVIDYIVSPALVVYTFILALYILKIIFAWELPSGGVALLVSSYITLVLSGNLLNKLLEKSHFDWFYNNFAYIAIAPLALLWIGTIYRISEYGFTEGRIFLLIANVLLTVFPFMLRIPATNRYSLLSIVLMAVMVVFTCIPPISAYTMGIKNQHSRFVSHAKELDIFDTVEWKLRNDIDVNKIRKDQALMDKLNMMTSELEYLRFYSDTVKQKYASWDKSDFLRLFRDTISFDGDSNWDNDDPNFGQTIRLSDCGTSVKTDGFDKYYFETSDFSVINTDSILKVKCRDNVILEYHLIDSLYAAGPDLNADPMRVLKYHNDSIMVVIKEMNVIKDDDGCLMFDYISTFNIMIFGK